MEKKVIRFVADFGRSDLDRSFRNWDDAVAYIVDVVCDRDVFPISVRREIIETLSLTDKVNDVFKTCGLYEKSRNFEKDSPRDCSDY